MAKTAFIGLGVMGCPMAGHKSTKGMVRSLGGPVRETRN